MIAHVVSGGRTLANKELQRPDLADMAAKPAPASIACGGQAGGECPFVVTARQHWSPVANG